jgi:hypothetical protein
MPLAEFQEWIALDRIRAAERAAAEAAAARQNQ